MHLKKTKQLFICLGLMLVMMNFGFRVSLAESNTQEVKTIGGGLISRIAPGEFLPISVKLVNFGGGRRVDVNIEYQILNSDGKVVLMEGETVAVETTASFIKNIQIPHNFFSGEYTTFSKVTYEGQEVPATSRFQFTVERKIAGVFVSQLILYGAITLLVGIVFVVISRLILKRRMSRLVPHEYPDVLKQNRLFYEIISDIIMQMRCHVGNRAIKIANNIESLSIDENNGKVLEINKDPTEIVTLLMLQYKKHLGAEIKFLPRKLDKKTKNSLIPIKKNLDIVKKYFK